MWFVSLCLFLTRMAMVDADDGDGMNTPVFPMWVMVLLCYLFLAFVIAMLMVDTRYDKALDQWCIATVGEDESAFGTYGHMLNPPVTHYVTGAAGVMNPADQRGWAAMLLGLFQT